jgi:signal recognition particle subunit SRP19
MVEKVLWPAYFDAARSRGEGRRVPADLAVEEPAVDEVASAVQQVGYDATIERGKAYPRNPRTESGRVLVDVEDANKNDLVQATAAYVAALRE